MVNLRITAVTSALFLAGATAIPASIPEAGHRTRAAPTFKHIPLTEKQFSADTSMTVLKGSQPTQPKARADPGATIIGVDDRRLFVSNDYPYTAVGHVEIIGPDWGASCTGSLVGPRHVVTARHCVVEYDGVVSLEFAPGFDKTARYGSYKVTHAITAPVLKNSCETKADWAILILDEPVGKKHGWFGVKSPAKNKYNSADFTSLGYPTDLDDGKRPYRMPKASILNEDGNWQCGGTGPFETDVDSFEGQSGSAFWETSGKDVYIWGVLSGGLESNEGGVKHLTTIFASGPELVSHISRVQKEYA